MGSGLRTCVAVVVAVLVDVKHGNHLLPTCIHFVGNSPRTTISQHVTSDHKCSLQLLPEQFLGHFSTTQPWFTINEILLNSVNL